ncbi:MAG TPA: hypothetical protein VKD91_08775 [Pyrinomonadaceae bacterium]|nr:hypothetical protein [Pyrinomonadaceae bacterium]
MATVIAVIDDLFFASKVRGAAEQAGIQLIFARSPEELEAAARNERPSLIVADLNSKRCDPVTLASRLKSDAPLKTVPLLGFFSHVDVELQRRAKDAGFDQTITRSALAGTLAQAFAEIKRADS